MCQIISAEGKLQDFYEVFKNEDDVEELILNLDKKGGDFYSLAFFMNTESSTQNIKKTFAYNISGRELIQEFIYYFERLFVSLKDFKKNPDCVFVLFSRQTPEMEKHINMENKEEIIKKWSELIDITPPFINQYKYYWVHGTINNDKEIEKKLEVVVPVDTATISYKDQIGIENYKGLFTYVEVDIEKNLKFKIVDKGMGYYKDFYKNIKWYSMTPNLWHNYKLSDPRNTKFYVSYSGGMDITLSTYATLIKTYYTMPINTKLDVDLIYFSYGSRAEEKEIEACEKFKKYLEKNLDFLKTVNIQIIDIKEIINKISNVFDFNIKLTDENAKPDIKETEENLSYVPYRNSIFVELLGTLMDKKNEVADIILGLNLTEGMVFGDNHEKWLLAIEQVVKYGGKTFKDLRIHAPYINDTKTNMLKKFKSSFGDDVLNDLLNISFSCYYPKNGEPCGECGSCVLRKKALENLN